MSDEEKKAIIKLSSKKNETTWDDIIRQIKRDEIKDVVVTRQKYITTVLNLIERQQKEIEELVKVSKECIEEKFNNDNMWEDKIKAKVIEVKDRPVKDEFITATQGKLDTIIDIESLLGKE